MIVEVPVIGALAFHVLFYVKEGSFSLFELPVKQLQFSPCPFHSIPASIHLDLAGFCKCEPGFAEPERLCKRDHLRKSFLLCCYIFDCPFQKFVFFVDQFTQVLGHLIQLFHCIL